MAIIRTDEWLEKDWRRPEVLCERLEAYFPGGKPRGIYRELLTFGIYRPSANIGNEVRRLIEKGVWEKAEELFRKYRAKWKGPDIPIFIFPSAKKTGFLRKSAPQKSGVSYPDKLFLFLPDFEDNKELEALFVHEYHHTCRINAIGKDVRENTLLESMVMEGLAEYAVKHECGEQYQADWCSLYSEKELNQFYKILLQNNLNIKKSDKEHDRLLFGGNGIPRLLGYCYGYFLVKNYYKSHGFSVENSFQIKETSFFL
ncbi:hypothetical protein DRW41_17695 [Neobacillus piezotolerans]|uniref:DUF2268 domain-containing protein n=1 Tax=Neobacillus piezotolerans TaxID=2259171 RepID=A0A3D8GMV8_9BACI|nr:DUF2268 domain-containing protein [Neobacillus piezotolerans]RDU35569.1 hypothetical protein DRW41_17695 [Neobacillus piezotolerans]